MRFILCFVGILIGSTYLFGQTNVSGGIYQNTTWSLSGSPYIVTGSIVVFPGKTLTIDPGCEVLIDNQTNADIYIEARGSINMIGLPGNQIRIRTIHDTTIVGWRGFKCITSQGGSIQADRFSISNALYPFDFEGNQNTINYNNCVFAHNQQAIRVDSSVVLNSCVFRNNIVGVYGWARFSINNCFFQSNGTAVNAYVTSFEALNSSFIDNDAGITFSSGVYEGMSIENCNFSANGIGVNQPNNGNITACIFTGNVTGIGFAHDCTVSENIFSSNQVALVASFGSTILNNSITENNTGVVIENLTTASIPPLIMNNEICSNTDYNVDNQTNLNLTLETNCFCGIDSTEVELFLFDGYDDITKGLFNYSIYDSACIELYGTVLKFGNATSSLVESKNIDYKFTNPVIDKLMIEGSVPVSEICISDATGTVTKRYTNEPSSFDLHELSGGVYFIRFETLDQQSISHKIIKL